MLQVLELWGLSFSGTEVKKVQVMGLSGMTRQKALESRHRHALAQSPNPKLQEQIDPKPRTY